MPIPLAYNVRNLVVRRWTTLFTLGGVALVVAATMLLAALVGGLQQMLVATGEADNLVVLRKGATSDGSSQMLKLPAEAWQMNEKTHTFGMFTSKVVTKVEIDPDEVFADIDRTNNVWNAAGAGVS